MATNRICSVPACCNPHMARGWCPTHYWRWRKHGDPCGGPTFRGAPLRFFRDVVLAYAGDECLIWPFSSTTRGYATVHIGGGVKRTVSNMVCEHFYGPPPTSQHEAAHACGNGHKGCVTQQHLRWATKTENEADKIVHDTIQRGERAGGVKLTEVDVQLIRVLCGSMSQRKVADRFGVCQSTISLINLRKNWAWLE